MHGMENRNGPKSHFLDRLRDALAADGLILRGGFHADSGDGAPPGTGTLTLVGNAGPAMWRAFERARPAGPDPLDRWTRLVLSGVADRFGAVAVYPFEGPPYAPFLRWAKRAEAVFDSPLGMAIHPEYGLWHAWRGALAFPDRLTLSETAATRRPCDGCAAQPCLIACPVDAFRDGVYDVAACADHLRSSAGADCMERGCRARRACPVGKGSVYAPAQAAFHMDAFLRNR